VVARGGVIFVVGVVGHSPASRGAQWLVGWSLHVHTGPVQWVFAVQGRCCGCVSETSGACWRSDGQPGCAGGPSGGIRWCDAGKRSDGGMPSAASPRSSLACIGPVMIVSGRVRVFGCAGAATPLPRTSTLLSVSLPRGLLTPG
jgi:hypothetical protein